MFGHLFSKKKEVSYQKLMATQQHKEIYRPEFLAGQGWQTSPKDALKVDILSSEQNAHKKGRAKFTQIASNSTTRTLGKKVAAKRKVTSERSEEAVIADSADNDEIITVAKRLSVYSSTKSVVFQLKQQLRDLNVEIEHVSKAEASSPEYYPYLDSFDAWVFIMSDADEEDGLDAFFDRYTDKPSIFLFESKLNDKAGLKVEEFVSEFVSVQNSEVNA